MTIASRSWAWLLPLCASVSSPVSAQSREPLQLDWRAPKACPQTEWLRERVRGLVSSRTLATTRLQVRGVITQRSDGRYRLELVMQEGDLVGKRDLVSDSCENLAGAAAVAVGLLLRADEAAENPYLDGPPAPNGGATAGGAATPSMGGSTPSTGGSTPSSGGSTAAAPAPSSRPRPVPPEPDDEPSVDGGYVYSPPSVPRSWRVVLRAPFGAADVGPLSSPSLGLGAGLGVRADQWSVIVHGTWWREQPSYGNDLPGYGAQVARKTGGLTVARGFDVGPLELGPSVTIAGEHVSARGVGPDVAPQEDRVLWLSAGLGVFAALRFDSSVALVAELGGRVQTARPVISIDGLGSVRRFWPAAFTSSLAAEWSF